MASEDWFLRLDPYNFDTEEEFNNYHYGVTHFSWYADITKDDAIDFLKRKYIKYLNKIKEN